MYFHYYGFADLLLKKFVIFLTIVLETLSQNYTSVFGYHQQTLNRKVADNTSKHSGGLSPEIKHSYYL